MCTYTWFYWWCDSNSGACDLDTHDWYEYIKYIPFCHPLLWVYPLQRYRQDSAFRRTHRILYIVYFYMDYPIGGWMVHRIRKCILVMFYERTGAKLQLHQ